MDENQIGPNMNTTPVQKYGRDGPYPSGKAVPCNWMILGSNHYGVIMDYRQIQGHHGKFFFSFFFVLTFPAYCRSCEGTWCVVSNDMFFQSGCVRLRPFQFWGASVCVCFDFWVRP